MHTSDNFLDRHNDCINPINRHEMCSLESFSSRRRVDTDLTAHNSALKITWFDCYDLNNRDRMGIGQCFVSAILVERATTHTWGRPALRLCYDPICAWWVIQPRLLTQNMANSYNRAEGNRSFTMKTRSGYFHGNHDAIFKTLTGVGLCTHKALFPKQRTSALQ